MKLRFVESRSTNPFLNVAVENYFLSLPDDETITLYLWRNHRTVVIGMNQNPFAECNVETLEAEGGYLMRRRTGGGAVYHDDGNLNFSFVASNALYDQQKQFSVLMRAVAMFGLNTELSGRNDVLCNGRKFSGNAFAKGKYNRLHHGTILIGGNMTDMQRYLKVKQTKLQKHGVASVQSRVVNLGELNDAITCQTIAPMLLQAFEEVYDTKADVLDWDCVSGLEGVLTLRDEFASNEWRFGNWREFKAQFSKQYSWGNVDIELNIDEEHRKIIDVSVATDSLDVELSSLLKQMLIGASTEEKPPVPKDWSTERQMAATDVLTLIY
ncbi:MAG: lipoate--protein ligase [Bacteroidales bacterium]|nr:lipoate--protein ligase [Bacteroidales bacterium]